MPWSRKRKLPIAKDFSLTILQTHTYTQQVSTYFLSRQVVGSQQSSYETNIDLKHGYLSILGTQDKRNTLERTRQTISLSSYEHLDRFVPFSFKVSFHSIHVKFSNLNFFFNLSFFWSELVFLMSSSFEFFPTEFVSNVCTTFKNTSEIHRKRSAVFTNKGSQITGKAHRLFHLITTQAHTDCITIKSLNQEDCLRGIT